MKNIVIASVSLLVLLIVGACNKSSQLGANLFDGNNLNLSFTDTTTVVAQTENPDPVLAVSVIGNQVLTNFTKLPLGKMLDPVFGLTEARIYANLGYPNATAPALDGAATYILDSVMFVLSYNGADAYGDTTQKQSISLYRLA